ncbi:hypothetical protein V5F41_12530 [Xanthobacter autotrophicus]|uniref:hypothetical protein n=1 Tax=Xanthobacter autotrophicus TaxID=280 RepID=UPI00372A60FA
MASARSHVEWLRAQRAAMATEYARARRRHERADPLARILMRVTCDLLRAEMASPRQRPGKTTARKAKAAAGTDLFTSVTGCTP